MGGDMSPLHFAKFAYGQVFGKLPYPATSFAGKTVIVTGSNVGLGFEASRHIVRLGAAKLIMAVRTVEKGEAAKSDIVKSTGCDPKIIEVWKLDLSSYDSIKAFATRAGDLDRIDILLENAGVATLKWSWTNDGESCVSINVIATFLLAFLMLPKLKETATKYNTRPTLTFVVSETHSYVDFDERNAPEGILNNMNDKSKANVADRYPTSKLMQILLIREMAKRKPVDSYPITLNMVNPGLCQSELARDGDLRIKVVKFLLARSTEVGSRTLVHGAGSGAETHGEYLSACKIAQTGTFVGSVEGEKAQTRLWNEVMEKLDKIFPGVSANL
ncbi:hypothetical protein FQN54_006400 [Arachnomyces sp. PD_36]|nr:hypothetical protein FQN54_006400 [Arachnomyces sp. PD_36]